MATPKPIDTVVPAPTPEQEAPEQTTPEQPAPSSSNTLTVSPLSDPAPASKRAPIVQKIGDTIRIDY